MQLHLTKIDINDADLREDYVFRLLVLALGPLAREASKRVTIRTSSASKPDVLSALHSLI